MLSVKVSNNVAQEYKEVADAFGMSQVDFTVKLVDLLKVFKQIHDLTDRNPNTSKDLEKLLENAKIFYIIIYGICLDIETYHKTQSYKLEKKLSNCEQLIINLRNNVDDLNELNLKLTKSCDDYKTKYENQLEANQCLSICNNDFKSSSENLRNTFNDLERQISDLRQMCVDKDKIIKILGGEVQNESCKSDANQPEDVQINLLGLISEKAKQ
jgi:hypothetical protein